MRRIVFSLFLFRLRLPVLSFPIQLNRDEISTRKFDVGVFTQAGPKAETERHGLYEECFNGDGAVVSYLNNAPRTKETTMNLCHEAVDVADRQWTRKFVQEPADHKDIAAPDDLSVVLGFTQMLSGGGNEDEVSRLATDHGWLDASGELTAAGDQLARALLQQNGTRTE